MCSGFEAGSYSSLTAAPELEGLVEGVGRPVRSTVFFSSVVFSKTGILTPATLSTFIVTWHAAVDPTFWSTCARHQAFLVSHHASDEPGPYRQNSTTTPVRRRAPPHDPTLNQGVCTTPANNPQPLSAEAFSHHAVLTCQPATWLTSVADDWSGSLFHLTDEMMTCHE